jgi:hypothetical protein
MKRITALCLLALLVGCDGGRAPELSQPVGHGYEVERLFTHEGCTVYRFMERGGYRYFTNCSGSTSWTQSCGKNCSRPVEVSGGGQ